MSFGSSITTYSQLAEGTYGYLVGINLINYLPYKITSVQAQASSALTPAPVTTETAYETLLTYLEDDGCPDIAFSVVDNDVYIFLKTTAFPYSAGTRISIAGLRDAQKLIAVSDYLDIPEIAYPLFLLYLKKGFYKMKGYQTRDFDLQIRKEEERLENIKAN